MQVTDNQFCALAFAWPLLTVGHATASFMADLAAGDLSFFDIKNGRRDASMHLFLISMLDLWLCPPSLRTLPRARLFPGKLG